MNDKKDVSKESEKSKWFEECCFIISYGVEEADTPLGKFLEYKGLELLNGSTDIEEYEKLSLDDKKESLIVVFSNNDGTLRLTIPAGKIMKSRDKIEKLEKTNDFLIGKKGKVGMPLEEMGAVVESIDENGEKTQLGLNYSLYPISVHKHREREKEFLHDNKEINKKEPIKKRNLLNIKKQQLHKNNEEKDAESELEI